jgi:hypothetical protein
MNIDINTGNNNNNNNNKAISSSILYVANNTENRDQINNRHYQINRIYLYSENIYYSNENDILEINQWLGIKSNCGMIQYKTHPFITYIWTINNLVEEKENQFLKDWPPSLLFSARKNYILNHLKDKRYVYKRDYSNRDDLDKLRANESGIYCMKNFQVWNCFRLRENKLVDIALNYERTIYCTVDLDEFINHQLITLQLYIKNGIVCFGLDWKLAENEKDDNHDRYCDLQEWNKIESVGITKQDINQVLEHDPTKPFESKEFITNYEYLGLNRAPIAKVHEPLVYQPFHLDDSTFMWCALALRLQRFQYQDIKDYTVIYNDNNPLNLIKSNRTKIRRTDHNYISFDITIKKRPGENQQRDLAVLDNGQYYSGMYKNKLIEKKFKFHDSNSRVNQRLAALKYRHDSLGLSMDCMILQ